MQNRKQINYSQNKKKKGRNSSNILYRFILQEFTCSLFKESIIAWLKGSTAM